MLPRLHWKQFCQSLRRHKPIGAVVCPMTAPGFVRGDDMKKLFIDLFTGVDGATFDLGRVLLALGCIIMAGGGVMTVVRGSLDFVAFGTGFGGLLVGGGGLLALKRTTEPTQVTATSTDTAGRTATSSVTTGTPDPQP